MEKERELLAIRSEYQTKLEKEREEATAKLRELYSRIVALEGHERLTAYLIDTEYIPPELEVIIGFSEDFVAWDLYGISRDGQQFLRFTYAK
ncbi:hypothetical protein FE784_11615 [Paenibacillus hemerocallicola]|uniref:Uncharacterized protein n=1 Tax=Paenibacillus hemerocallicola TaxID=1172614 RepID=A0A5C4TAF5_9BACL|nr:hypothetical protein [Paenibacillus hemerocallicola]TNJ66064.1 hypothetical protein FE784_11615 [Paenibacillus hemerocallicola]